MAYTHANKHRVIFRTGRISLVEAADTSRRNQRAENSREGKTTVKEQQQRSDNLTNENEQRGACSLLWKMFVGQHRIQKGRLVFRPLMHYWACLDGQHKKEAIKANLFCNQQKAWNKGACCSAIYSSSQRVSTQTELLLLHTELFKPQQMLFPVVNMCLIGTFVCFLSHKGSPQQMDPHILFGNILRQLPFPQSPSWAFVPPPLRLQLFCILSKCNNNYIWDFHVRLAAKITDVWR